MSRTPIRKHSSRTSRLAPTLRRWSQRRYEQLEDRLAMAVTASFSASTGVLTVLGDSLDNTIEISRNVAGTLLVNGGAVAIQGGAATVANTALVKVFALGGHDQVEFKETNGALPAGLLDGGGGNDTLIGGAGGDQIFGQGGNDVLFGKGGVDFLFGGAGGDTLIGGDAGDVVFGEAGNDTFIWNPGDDTDLNEGGDGTDTVVVNGSEGGEAFTVTANGTRVRFDRLDPAPFSIDIGTSEKLTLNANGGNDTFSATGNLAALISLTIDGGAGDDTLLGSNGVDTLRGGDGDDFIDGQQGNDVAFLGAGNDVFQWDPGDGSDSVEGEGGMDRLLFHGSAGDEIFAITPKNQKVQFTRNLGSIVMNLNGLEIVDLHALGGADTVQIGSLAGTHVSEVNIELEGSIGGGAGDAKLDTVIVNGTSSSDNIQIVGSGGSYAVIGLAALVQVEHSEPTDALVVSAGSGNDFVTATTLPAGVVKLTIDGGAGSDNLLGSMGDDVILGGASNDTVAGLAGNDVVLLGDGNDTFTWNPGDGNDTLEGQGGTDKLLFNGSNADEIMNLVANGGRVLMLRNVANVVLDMNDMERVDVELLGGADSVFVGDLSGTDLLTVNLDLENVVGSGQGDGQIDSISVSGTNGNDTIAIANAGAGVSVKGLAAQVNILRTEGTLGRLTINALGGDDAVSAAKLSAGRMLLTVNGGLGVDTITGSAGDDVVVGGDGNDVVNLGNGDDTFVWNPGDDNDLVEGQAGNDKLLFNGANVAEQIDLSANGARLRFFRNVANVIIDSGTLEVVDFNAFGGSDVIVVNDLSATSVVEVNLHLGGGDLAADTVVVMGTAADDVILLVGDASGASVLGLAAVVNVTGGESANDRIAVNALAGDDAVEASGMSAQAIGVYADGGEGNDVLIGGDGNDVLLGGEGDDVLLGGLGLDILDGGPGDNVVIQ